MNDGEIIDWLLSGDVAVEFQTRRDLLGSERPDLQARIATEGWGKQFMDARNPKGGWGQSYYQPKWLSSHYTLLDLCSIEISPQIALIKFDIAHVLSHNKSKTDGGMLPIGKEGKSDVCVNGMFLNFACYFGAEETELRSIVDFVLAQHMTDGGFNCRSNRGKPHHSSLHTTCSVLEGFQRYLNAGYRYRSDEVISAMGYSEEFLLVHQLFLSDRTGEVIDPRFLKLSYPYRWYYSILRALDYLQRADHPWDERLQPAIDVLKKKRRKDRRWNVQAKIPGQSHFNMERAGQPSRWVTLFAMRVFKHFGVE